jgi:hypothetical protein
MATLATGIMFLVFTCMHFGRETFYEGGQRVCRSWWPRGLRRRSEAAWLLGSRARIPLWVWMFVSCVYMLCYPV